MMFSKPAFGLGLVCGLAMFFMLFGQSLIHAIILVVFLFLWDLTLQMRLQDET